MTEPITHDSICLLAEKFLVKNVFGVVFHDKFKAYTSTGEQPDCLGFFSKFSKCFGNSDVLSFPGNVWKFSKKTVHKERE